MSFGFHTWGDAHDINQTRNPVAGAGTVTGTYLDMRGYTKGVAIINVGNLVGTVDASIYQGTDSSGTSAKAVSSSSITQLTATDDNKVVVVEWDVQKQDHANSFYFAIPRLVITNANTVTGATVLRTRAKGLPVSNSNLEELVQVLSN